MKIAVITCYKDPDYIRASTLRTGLSDLPNVKTIIIKNHTKGVLRYFEVLYRIIKLKREQEPDVYFLTYRGQEVLPFMLMLAAKKPVVFDEFFVPIVWAKHEVGTLTIKNKALIFIAKLTSFFYQEWLSKCRFILSDTNAHAEVSARISGVNSRSYRVLPVGADERLFKPDHSIEKTEAGFSIFFYGSMSPLHGLDTILKAAESLKANKDITFRIIGGGHRAMSKVADSQAAGANIIYHSWIQFEELPEAINSADICLGGPFGNTLQAQQVITGKTYQFLACAVPVIIGETKGGELFVNKENCLIVPQADYEALVKAISWSYSHRSEIKTIGKNGRSLYEKAFSASVIKQTLSSIVDELAE